MLERYLSHMLTTKFGHIFENFDENKVRVSAWNGEIVLEDLYLKQNSSDALLSETPLEIRYGHIGKLEVKIPWKVLRSRAKDVNCSLILSDVCILISPKRSSETPTDTEESEPSLAEKRTAKEEKVQALMDAKLFTQSMDGASNKSSQWRWIHEWLTSLVSNLSVTVHNVHIRYEDSGNSFGLVWNDANTSSAFSVGMTLRQFSVQTTDRGHKEEVQSYEASEAFSVTHKLAAAYQLSIYWDRGCALMSMQVEKIMKENSVKIGDEVEYYANSFQLLNEESIQGNFVHSHMYKRIDHTYFLNPISPSLQLSLVQPVLQKGQVATEPIALPPSSVSLTLPPTQFVLSKNVLEDAAYLRKCFAIWNQIEKSRLPRKAVRYLANIRPKSSPSHDPRSWWKYAFNSVVIILKSNTENGKLQSKRNHGWLCLARALGSRGKYSKLYSRLMASTSEVEKNSIHHELVKMEDTLEAESIIAFRIYSCNLDYGCDNTVGFKALTVAIKKKDIPKVHILDHMDDMYLSSVDYRCQMYQEMSQCLENERFKSTKSPKMYQREVASNKTGQNSIVWRSLLLCPEVSLQINMESPRKDQARRKRKGLCGQGSPIARLSCSALYRQFFREDGSWDATASIATFEILDLSSRRGTGGTLFPVLIGRKGDDSPNSCSGETVLIQGVEHRLCISVTMTRKRGNGRLVEPLSENTAPGSTTTTTVRLLPLEVVYSTKPIAALTNIILTVRTPELSNDFHRMAAAVSKWQQDQRKRLLQALAHKRKQIIVDIDFAAPVLFIPETVQHSESPMLVIDFGRLQFCNTDDDNVTTRGSFDDIWKLCVCRIQMLNTTVAAYRNFTNYVSLQHQIIEPFSLDFTISTSFSADDVTTTAGGKTLVGIKATLPRLVFNLTTSSVRLFLRLQRQWKRQTIENTENERQSTHYHQIEAPSHSARAIERSSAKGNNNESCALKHARFVQFNFSAPLIGLKLENDVDGRDCIDGQYRQNTTIGHLVLRGISGAYQQVVSESNLVVVSFDANIKSLEAIDLYQKAGAEFSLFLVSASPHFYKVGTFSLDEVLDGKETDFNVHESEVDLVSVMYHSRKYGLDMRNILHDALEKDILAISFHELFVEWNPETIAAIHKAIQLPSGTFETSTDLSLDELSCSDKSGDECEISHQDEGSDDEFFDALDCIYDLSHSSFRHDDDSRCLSEISSFTSRAEEGQFLASRTDRVIGSPIHASSMLYHFIPTGPLRREFSPLFSNFLSPLVGLTVNDMKHGEQEEIVGPVSQEWRLFEVSFDLSKLRIHFNKESRCRRLLVAEMDGTAVSFRNRQEGGTATTARIGNLTLSDPCARSHSTLYDEIVGLQSDTFVRSDEKQSSLLELSFLSNPRTRNVVTKPESNMLENSDEDENYMASVDLDTHMGVVSGSDYFVMLQFSPMRFVYLQQLWFEVIDYFFEGIIGTEVWGNTKPALVGEYINSSPNEQFIASSERQALPGADAIGLRFTRFVIKIASPIVLVPVAYRSPQFIRLEFESLRVANRYSSSIEKARTNDPNSRPFSRVQWFNNCIVTLKGLRVKSWCGTSLSRDDVRSSSVCSESSKCAHIHLSWPTGIGALHVRPKWNVNCSVDDINIYLRPIDYALLQNVIVHNIGEPSRHLHEWIARKALPNHELPNQIMVCFGYDKKDDMPTTYKVEVRVPSLIFFLVEGLTKGSGESIVAEARCVNLLWGMTKLSDFITRQRVSCDIVISQPSVFDGITKTVHLILPSERDSAHLSSTAAVPLPGKLEPSVPELVYTSTSRTSGDNVKSVDISNACIHFIYPAWTRVSSFFSGLELPEMWTEKEISLSMQVGDRWYQIGASDSNMRSCDQSDAKPVISRQSASLLRIPSPTYQFHLRLNAPRVVLKSTGDGNEQVSVILRMDHLDYLHDNTRVGAMARSFFVHNLELYTSATKSMKRDNYLRKNSLIRPWSLIGVHKRCNKGDSQHCHQHQLSIQAEVLHARAAYSDMSIAVDVGLRLLSDLRSSGTKEDKSGPKEISDLTKNIPSNCSDFVCIPSVESLIVGFDGLNILVVDDSLRHFAEAQELIELSLESIRFLRERKITTHTIFSMRIQLANINLYDHLQPIMSPFRLAATSQEGDVKGKCSLYASKHHFEWVEYSSKRSDNWGVDVSETFIMELNALNDSFACDMIPSLTFPSACAVDLQSIVTQGISRNFDGSITSLTMQWNPSTVIALQRFLGRLMKEASQKSTCAYQESLVILLPTQSTKEVVNSDTERMHDLNTSIIPREPIKASIHLNCLTLCLNKEHQNRRLLRATFTSACVDLFVDCDSGVLMQGAVKDVSAWDADNYGEQSSITDSNRRILRVASSTLNDCDDCVSSNLTRRFFCLEFKTYPPKSSSPNSSFPSWIQALLASMNDESQRVDDYLNISIAALEFTFLRERTDELLDYLSNGLPGKGMGATSRAAKGFINKRIQTRSFLKLAIDSPQLRVPQRESVDRGIFLKLGDFGLQSWFQEGSVTSMSDFSLTMKQNVSGEKDKDWWRMLSLSILGLGWATYGGAGEVLTETKQMPVDLLLDLRKPTTLGRTTLVKGSLSYVDLVLAYSDYILCRSVFTENIGKKVSMERWDNVEKAFWMEQVSEKSVSERVFTNDITDQHRVAYSSNARFVRYGLKPKDVKTFDEVEKENDASDAPSDNKVSINFAFNLGGLRLMFHRDDHIRGFTMMNDTSTLNYDVVLFKVENIETSMTTRESGEISFHLLLYRMGIFDLGDLGRLARYQYYQNLDPTNISTKIRSPSAFCVLAEGYSPTDQSESGHTNDAQLVVTVDTCPAASTGSVGIPQSIDFGAEKVTIARIVVNHLSVNALVRPLQDITSFLSCAWPLPGEGALAFSSLSTKAEMADISSPSLMYMPNTQSSGFQLKVVAHYPRIFFVADESDPRSRALVLRGLAVINASRFTHKKATLSKEGTLGHKQELTENHVITALDAHLHSMESYINPDVRCALSLQQHHVEMMDRSLNQMSHVYFAADEYVFSRSDNSLGVALIEPVTMSVELCRVSKDRFPTLRSMHINIEPVSTMFSFEDLSLLRVIIARLSSSRATENREGPHQQSVTRSSRDGTMPTKFLDVVQDHGSQHNENARERVVVEFTSSRLGLLLRSSTSGIVVDSVHNVTHSPQIKEGDRLLTIDGSLVNSMALQDIVETLAKKPRPTTLVFERVGGFKQDFNVTNNINKAPTTFVDGRHKIDSFHESELSYTITFVRGCFNGLSLERSPVCNAPVVALVNIDKFLESVLTSPDEELTLSDKYKGSERLLNIRAPMKGAIIVGVNEHISTELGFIETSAVLNQLCGDISTRSVVDVGHRSTYTIRFVELDSDTLGNIDCVDVAITGISLTFIDDIKGRDMPLLRGRLGGIAVRLERGIGIETSLIESRASIIVQDVPSFIDNVSSKDGTHDNVADGRPWGHLAKPIIKAFAALQAEVEYYHPKIAAWEPFIEPSQFCAAVEWQPGYLGQSNPKCGQLAIRLSDRLAQSNRSSSQTMNEQDAVTINLTDSAAEVILRSYREWEEWTNTSDFSFEGTQSKFPTVLLHSRHLVEGKLPKSTVSEKREKAVHASDTKIAQRKAAQAALVFAQKRGASTKKQGDSSKPFVLKNRTGLEIMFSYEKPDVESSGTVHDQEDCVVADGQDARFSMEMISNSETGRGKGSIDLFRRGVKKVRTYEGRFPRLSISFHAPDSVVLAPVRDLPASKVGKVLRNIKCDTKRSGVSSVSFLWSVEVEDNRRILTISSSVKIASTGLGTSIEIGFADPSLLHNRNETEIVPLGYATPLSPFFVPLWLTLRFEDVSIFVRPIYENVRENQKNPVGWSHCEILHFSLRLPHEALSHNNKPDVSSEESWAWRETFDTTCSISCGLQVLNPTNEPGPWLSCRVEPRDLEIVGVSAKKNFKLQEKNAGKLQKRGLKQDVITIVIDSSMTLRNMLPSHLEWQIAVKVEANMTIISGSSIDNVESTLSCGSCVDVIACDVMKSNVHVRFRCKREHQWTAWETVALNLFPEGQTNGSRSDRGLEYVIEANDTGNNLLDQTPDLIPQSRQVNLQSKDEFGDMLTLGLRMIPKVVKGYRKGIESFTIYGVDMIVYSELWLRNTTTLPLSFGCPSIQIHRNQWAGIVDDAYTDSGKMVAEAALLEIASVLEFGDKGKNLKNKNEELTSKLCQLSFQESSMMIHEVFEYIEMENLIEKRRWWACEDPFIPQVDPLLLNEITAGWHWIDEKWQIDCSGQTSFPDGGWESCRNLSGSKEYYFNGNRIFSTSHPYRRRRWFRRWATDCFNDESPKRLYGEINAFHQPMLDSFSKAQLREKRRTVSSKTKGQSDSHSWDSGEDDYNRRDALQVSIKIGDSAWCLPASIPHTGSAHGVFRVPASRWSMITKTSWATAKELRDPMESSFENSTLVKDLRVSLGKASLSPEVYEFCFHVQDLAGDWGDFTRTLDVTPRFLLQNDSEIQIMEVKQSGAPSDAAVIILPGALVPFHWADFRLPELISVRPYCEQDEYRWSGGFDISRLGMNPIRVRLSKRSNQSAGGSKTLRFKSVRALVEIRSGSGGSGIKVSFREEEHTGDGALFRIENHSPFPIWFLQDDVLANPSTKGATRNETPIIVVNSEESDLHSIGWSDDRAEIDGDLIKPNSQTAYALDVPFRQGKYAHRRVATMKELLRVRIALAPLSSRDGIETTKVIGLTQVGERVRLNITKIGAIAASGIVKKITSVRVMGIVTTDGPTRVLNLMLIEKEDSSDILNAFSEGMGYNAKPQLETLQERQQRNASVIIGRDEFWRKVTIRAALDTLEIKSKGKIPSEEQAKRKAFFGDGRIDRIQNPRATQGITDIMFSFQASFSGFLLSLVDATPSEIAVISLKGLNVAAKWDGERKADASALISVDWLQVDNHIPAAPFPVAICPDERDREDSNEQTEAVPLLLVGLTFAPKHKTGIMCLRNMTVVPRNLAVAVDLAFIVRLQRYLIGLQEHFVGGRTVDYELPLGQRHVISLPDISIKRSWTKAGDGGTESPKLYFEGLTILSANINLSVAPARALTNAQAALEGKEAAAIHAAVRKGDIGLASGLVGVNVGHTNKTAMAVVRGVFKSILVDTLLRLDGASLNLSGVFLRNHISTAQQLMTFLGAHYVTSMRSNLPALIGSLAAFGNPIGLIRGLGDGVSDFVNEPVKGLKKSMQELDPFLFVDGVARGTESLARHTVGGIAETASLLTETFSKNMAVLTLDRRYAQRRDRVRSDMRGGDVTFVEGVESGVVQLVRGVVDGVSGVVKAPMRGAERSGVEGFAKGIGKGLLGLLVKPMIGISDAATDFMIGVKGSVEGGQVLRGGVHNTRQIRPRRPMYGKDRVLRSYSVADAAAATLMLQTRLAGENYLSHLDMGDCVALLSVKEMSLLGPDGHETLHVKFEHVKSIEVRPCIQLDGSDGWGIVILLAKPRRSGSEVEIIPCGFDRIRADELCNQMNEGIAMIAVDS